MHIQHLATETITHIFASCTAVPDVLALASTCRRFHHILAGSQKLPILQHAAEAQFGPLPDLTQLLTHNASQPAHIHRPVPFSLALLAQILHVGRVADRWADIYPTKKWKYNFEDRRLLTGPERFRLRRAVYRLWLFCKAFHTPGHPREQRMHGPALRQRAALLHNFRTTELAEMADVHGILRDVVQQNICPSNGTIARKFRRRFPDAEPALCFNIHLNYPPMPPSPFAGSSFHNPNPSHLPNPTHMPLATSKFAYSPARYALSASPEPGAEGWGDEVQQYYVIEDMLKLDPERILWLREHAPCKGQVEAYVKGLGEWFENNGDTWGQTVELVLRQRGEDIMEVVEGIAAREAGVVVEE